VEVVTDTVNGVQKNVLRLKAEAEGDKVTSAAVLQTANLYGSARYEVVARFPQKTGLVYAVWTFHYEHHFADDHLPPGQSDPQFLPNMTGWESRINHEIDIEMPASCSGFCDNGGCPGEWDTMNINSYVVTDASGGEGPGYVNMCVKAPAGKDFIDDTYHSYAFEWHAGQDGCKPRIDYFFDDEYIGTVDVFVPSRSSRLVFGMWPGNHNWVGNPDWEEAYGYVSEVHVCPFNEGNDASYPQIFDQPFNHEVIWEELVAPAARAGLAPSNKTCPGVAPSHPCADPTNRPNGCSCGIDRHACSSGCCDYQAVPGVVNGTCAARSVCEAECEKDKYRPFGCTCTKDSQCGSRRAGEGECCFNGVCATADSCKDPCSSPTGRPDKCACNLATACASGCCDYNAVPGVTNGKCASQDVCTTECASTSRPIGCQCGNSTLCQTGCCHQGVCQQEDNCPTPSACSAPSNRPVGCVCDHSWECSTNWCDGHCSNIR